jgi:P-type Ca2+ transporter type 2C
VARTMAFAVLSFCELVHVYSVRSSRYSVFSSAVGPNKYLLGANLLSALCMLAVLVVPPLETVFSTVNMSLAQWGIVAALSVTPLAVVEVMKALHLNGVKREKTA